MFDTEVLDFAFQSLNADDNTLGITGNYNYNKNNRKFTNILMARLCIYSLLRLQEDFRLSSTSSSRSLLPVIIIVDAGNTLDFYQFVEFIRQQELDIKETLQTIIIRAFTIHQLANQIINELLNTI